MNLIATLQCVVCHTTPSKYPCKMCRKPTCSLTCFKQHEKDCSSAVDPKPNSEGQTLAQKANAEDGDSKAASSYDTDYDFDTDDEFVREDMRYGIDRHGRPALIPDDEWNGPRVISPYKTSYLKLKYPSFAERIREFRLWLEVANEPSTSEADTIRLRQGFSREIDLAVEACENRRHPTVKYRRGDKAVAEHYHEILKVRQQRHELARKRLMGETLETEDDQDRERWAADKREYRRYKKSIEVVGHYPLTEWDEHGGFAVTKRPLIEDWRVEDHPDAIALLDRSRKYAFQVEKHKPMSEAYASRPVGSGKDSIFRQVGSKSVKFKLPSDEHPDMVALRYKRMKASRVSNKERVPASYYSNSPIDLGKNPIVRPVSQTRRKWGVFKLLSNEHPDILALRRERKYDVSKDVEMGED